MGSKFLFIKPHIHITRHFEQILLHNIRLRIDVYKRQVVWHFRFSRVCEKKAM